VQKFPSVRQYVPWLVRHGYELPGSYLHGEPPDRVTWVKPTYSRVLGMLKNPRYTGTYVLGESKTVWERTEEGPRAKRVLVPQSEWDIVIPNHHEAYLTVEEYEKNLAKLASNAAQYGGKVKGSPQKGESLLVGLLRCRRCGGKLKVNYSSKSSPRFRCTAGSRERDGSTKGCFSFAARRPEERFEEALLHVVRPAGLEAAVEAEKLFHKEYESRRQLLLDRLEDLRLRARDASERYHQADPRNTLVIPNLEKKWNNALLAVKEHEARLEQFEAMHRPLPTPEQRLELERLGEDLDRVWFRPQTDMVLKKQIVHLLVQEVLVDLDEEQNEIVLTIHWRGGHHTQLREPRHHRKPRSNPADVIAVVDAVRRNLEEDIIATTLNRSRTPTEKGETWTSRRVRALRKKHQIPSFDPEEKKRNGWLTQEEAATRLGVSPMSISRLVNWEILPALQAKPGLPAIILETDLGLEAVKKAAKTIQTNRLRPLPENPVQLSFFDTTNS